MERIEQEKQEKGGGGTGMQLHMNGVDYHTKTVHKQFIWRIIYWMCSTSRGCPFSRGSLICIHGLSKMLTVEGIGKDHSYRSSYAFYKNTIFFGGLGDKVA